MKVVREKIKTAIKHPGRILEYAMINTVFGRMFPDKIYLKIVYRLKMGKKLNLKNPQTFNEKLQWLKLYNRRDEYTAMVDKYEVRKYIADKLGEEYLIPCLGVWDKFDDIDFDSLPDQFVLKCTHDSGGLVICRDKSKLDIAAAKKKITKSLKRKYFYVYREWPYKNVKPRIIAEEYMVDESGTELKDYKFFCFDGEVKALYVATDRGSETHFDFYDVEFNHLPFVNGHDLTKKQIHKPIGFEEMKELASRLSKGFSHIRIDFYDINGKVYFGEMTFFHMGGVASFEPEQWDYKFGSWLTLPEK